MTSSPPCATATGQRVSLRSIERAMTLSDDHWFMVAHTMLVRGATHELAHHVPTALLKTFNKHPRMRLTLVRNAFATAVVHAPLTSTDELTQRGLLTVKHDATPEDMTLEGCRAFVQHVGHTPYDRYTQFPFAVHVWLDHANDCARLFVVSDHYTSDGSSGSTILHDVLAFAAELSRGTATPEHMPTEMALREGMYDAYLDDHAILAPVLRAVGKLAGPAIFSLMPPPAHVIASNKQQGDFCLRMPPPNPSTTLFADGTSENLTRIVAKCRAEHTTFTGALSAAVLLSYIIHTDALTHEAFQLKWIMAANMRHRVGARYAADAVGSFSHVSEIELPPVNVPHQTFWALARAIKKYSTDALANVPAMLLSFILSDQHMHRDADAKLLDNVPITGSTFNDLDVSSLGRYTYSKTHAFRDDQQLAIESLHYVARLPSLTALCQVYATSVDHVGYAMSHHYDEATGKALFDTAVAITETCFDIDATASLADVAVTFAK